MNEPRQNSFNANTSAWRFDAGWNQNIPMFVERPLFPPIKLRNCMRMLDTNEMIGQSFPGRSRRQQASASVGAPLWSARATAVYPRLPPDRQKLNNFALFYRGHVEADNSRCIASPYCRD